jgi:hypothetical protein
MKEYVVNRTVSDRYQIVIEAKDSAQALELALEIDLESWKHKDSETDYIEANEIGE